MAENEKTTEVSDEQIKIPEMLPVLPIRDIVIFPFMIIPLSVARDRSIKAVDQALTEQRLILLLAQKSVDQDDPKSEDLYPVGTVATIMRLLKLPDGRVRILVQGLARAQASSFDESLAFTRAKLEVLNEPTVNLKAVETEALIRNVKSEVDKAVNLGKSISPEILVIISNLDDPGRLADLVASNLELKVEVAQRVLESVDPVDRLRKINELLTKEIELLTVQQQIDTAAKADIDKSQREYYLRQQLKAIQQELGDVNELQEEINQYREKIEKAGMPAEVREEVDRQVKKLERMHPDAAETATLRNYLDWMVELPWSKQTVDNLDLQKAQSILDTDHYGLEKIKERIVDYLAVRKLKEKSKGPILCFVGPPGVGKTSLGKSIAHALDRKFVRLSLGGVHDEAEIRGHRRTYVGAMPGRIIQGIRQAGTNNPVFMLDEVDKIGADYRGDPSSALLEVLDPEQNFSFRDHYLGVPFDLSNVMFITTANIIDTIQPAFLDRMEVITLSGYTEQEKLQIAVRHLIPKQLNENGLKSEQIEFTESVLKRIITQYTREAGLRNLEREIGTVCRKVARRIAEGKTEKFRVVEQKLEEFLGPPKILPEEILKKDQVGVSTGLVWTPVGGEIIFVEATTMKGKGGLLLTGHLGEVMKESAQAALSYARAHAREFHIDEEFFANNDIHLHVPEGAIPKDGPSAGITMATAMISAFTGRLVKKSVAMTGEITLRGNVLPIGGLKEKVLAAHRAKIRSVIVPALNRKDLKDIPDEIRKDMEFIFVDNVKSVLDEALTAGPNESEKQKTLAKPKARKNRSQRQLVSVH
ncbi:MAG: endopeptidase La [Acidobacteriia bacterium]|nr:endopeptidase La [Terriglobia bacterium]